VLAEALTPTAPPTPIPPAPALSVPDHRDLGPGGAALAAQQQQQQQALATVDAC